VTTDGVVDGGLVDNGRDNVRTSRVWCFVAGGWSAAVRVQWSDGVRRQAMAKQTDWSGVKNWDCLAARCGDSSMAWRQAGFDGAFA